MKNMLLTIILFTASGASYSNAKQQYVGASSQPPMVRTVYVDSCSYPVPLYTSQRCSINSWAGQQAYECAADGAMNQCNADYNSDCVLASTSVTTAASNEFLGFRRCIGHARVHGYSIKY